MESLAYLVVIIFMTLILGGPVAILLTKIQTEHIILMILRRLLHGLVVALSLIVGFQFLFIMEVRLSLRMIGLYSISMGYIALRREYFPDVRIIAPILAKFGVKLWKKQKRSGSEQGSSHFGPVVKWRRSGGSGENDGHGPEGQH